MNCHQHSCKTPTDVNGRSVHGPTAAYSLIGIGANSALVTEIAPLKAPKCCQYKIAEKSGVLVANGCNGLVNAMDIHARKRK